MIAEVIRRCGVQEGLPLFRREDDTAFTTSEIRDLVKQVGEWLGKNTDTLGAHSLRIGGVIALFESGASPDAMKAAGRWAARCGRCSNHSPSPAVWAHARAILWFVSTRPPLLAWIRAVARQ